MARKAFYSFHYKPDASRAGQVRNIGVVEGNTPVSDNDWEAVTKEGRRCHQAMDCRPDARAVLHGCSGRQQHSRPQVD